MPFRMPHGWAWLVLVYAGRRGGQLPGAAPSQMEARVAPGQDLTGAAMATFLYDRLVAEEAG